MDEDINVELEIHGESRGNHWRYERARKTHRSFPVARHRDVIFPLLFSLMEDSTRCVVLLPLVSLSNTLFIELGIKEKAKRPKGIKVGKIFFFFCSICNQRMISIFSGFAALTESLFSVL